MEKSYIAIDLKSFYASVECIERGFDPMITNLVVADATKTSKTICLAVTPTLKSYGLSGRSRLFEVEQKIKEENFKRLNKISNRCFEGSSFNDTELKNNQKLQIDFYIAPPQMAKYIEFSNEIYKVYLKYIAPEDMHGYSIDEVFIDATNYLSTYKMSAINIAKTIVGDVLKTTGITSVAGVGTNLYLSKIAMDIMAKRTTPDENGFRVAYLDEMLYKRKLWEHKPLTDFWRIGKGYMKKLEQHGLYTMGDIARCSVGTEKEYYNEDLLYKLFGVNAELLIDHAWGYEPCTLEHVKCYKSESNSISSGQVLQKPYNFEDTKLVVREMAELLVLDLVVKGLVTDQIVLTIGYDVENIKEGFNGEIKIDSYGRKIPKHVHGTQNLKDYTSSAKIIVDATMQLCERILNSQLLSRRINIVAEHVVLEDDIQKKLEYEQLDLFSDNDKSDSDDKVLLKERSRQLAIVKIQKKYGKNAILKGMNLKKGATAKERNETIGGHKA